ncbi:hypothetical protein ACETRX_36440 [Labrys portucalensis]|uniref:Peptidase n=1 Tax=Labrys neptuniae TaxID=376174 RepID=A0ABV6ZSC9_9HYPH
MNFGSKTLCIVSLIALSACNSNDDSGTAQNSPQLFGQSLPAQVSGQSLPAQVNNLPPPNTARAFVWPVDHAVVDPNHYYEGQADAALSSAAYKSGSNGGAGDTSDAIAAASLDLGAVDETPSSKHHQMSLNGQTIDYTARAGHLVAYAPTDPANPTTRDAEASIFYMSYTRDDILASERPVTFVFNGGPGEPSIWLHLGAWAPKSLKVNAPNLPPGPDMPDSFPLTGNPQTLLDQTDLVFVDIVGSGFSQAIAPHTNKDLWNTNSDAQVFRDFITAYINRYNRQSSPKYLYGESYSGIRTPIVANLLVQAGTSQYAPDPSGKPAVVLTGFTLNSPVLDYATIGGHLLPTDGMTADYHGKGTARGSMSETEYADYLRKYTSEIYDPISNGSMTISTKAINDFAAITGIGIEDIKSDYEYIAGDFTYYFKKILYPNSSSASFNDYDYRISAGKKLNYQINSYEEAGFYGAIKPYLLEEFNYQNKDPAQLYGADVAFDSWSHNHGNKNYYGGIDDTSVPDIIAAMALEPNLKALVLHGYHDAVCPFFQSEVDLQNGGALPVLSTRLTVHDYEGGHMIYLTPASQVTMRADLRDFYRTPNAAASSSVVSVSTAPAPAAVPIAAR